MQTQTPGQKSCPSTDTEWVLYKEKESIPYHQPKHNMIVITCKYTLEENNSLQIPHEELLLHHWVDHGQSMAPLYTNRIGDDSGSQRANLNFDPPLKIHAYTTFILLLVCAYLHQHCMKTSYEHQEGLIDSNTCCTDDARQHFSAHS